MALKKDIKQANGITTTYHRISFIDSFVNDHTSIGVWSFVDAESSHQQDAYRRAITYEKDYQENMTVEQAYDYLKTLPEFEGAEDA